LIKLGLPGSIKGVEMDTRYFTGNYAPKISVQAAKLGPEEERKTKGLQKRVKRMGMRADEDELGQVNYSKKHIKIKSCSVNQKIVWMPVAQKLPDRLRKFQHFWNQRIEERGQ
jgi:allantoicase